jgi:segregation and condensation protein A
VSFRVQTQGYSGPFDLLLQLVTRKKVAIGAISISEVADQYLEEVNRMGDLDLDVASDFVLVASTLLDIKAASLVPEEPARVQDPDDLDDTGLEDLDPATGTRGPDRPPHCLQADQECGSCTLVAHGGREQDAAEHGRPDPEFLGPHA